MKSSVFVGFDFVDYRNASTGCIKKEITFHFADEMLEVLRLALE